jgi:hypothetical protein
MNQLPKLRGLSVLSNSHEVVLCNEHGGDDVELLTKIPTIF